MSGAICLDGMVICADVATGVAFSAILQRIKTTASTEGLSLQTLVALVTVRLLHLRCWHIGLHYQPLAIPANIFFGLDVVTALAGLASLSLFFLHFETYESSKDTFGSQLCTKYNVLPLANKSLMTTAILYTAVGITAILWYHIRYLAVHEDRPAGFYMSFYECMGALAYVPQLWMFHQDKRVPPLLARFVIAMAVHKFLVLCFWIVYPRVTNFFPPNRTIQIVFDTLSLCILADFIYYWARSKWHGLPEVILDSEIALSDLAYLSTEARGYDDHPISDRYLAVDFCS